MAKSTDPDPSKPLFTDEESFKAWLKDKPQNWAVDLAMRSALRAGMMLWPVHEPDAPNPFMANLILQTHRAFFILHTPSGDYTQRERAAAANAANAAHAAYVAASNAAANAAYTAAYASNAAAAAYAAAYAAANAAYAAAHSASAAANAANAAAHSADAAANATRVAWTELEQEARYLSLGVKRSGLLSSPLWRERPSWVDQRFEGVREGEWAQSPFNLWLAWYRLVLLGEPTDTVIAPKAAQDLAFDVDAFWTPDKKRPPDQIMREICARAGWDWEKAEIEPLPPVTGSEDRLGISNSPPKAPAEAEDSSGGEGSQSADRAGAPDESSAQKRALAETAHTSLQNDGLAEEDWLERRPLARTLARRIKAFYAKASTPSQTDPKTGLKSSPGLAINLTAPWGEGKTSVLHMLEQALKDPSVREDGQPASDWIVVHFNAWDHERRRPPWWAMLEGLYQSGLCQLKTLKGRDQHAIDFQSCWWRGFLQSDWALIALAGLLLVVVLGVGVSLAGVTEIGALIASVSGAAALATTAYLSLRGLVFGGAENANFHYELKRDPLSHSRRLFKGLIEAASGPVCIVIDDLDRCDADFVVDLLEGIQTAFRHPDVVYVVAADRKWIKAAFEHRYTEAFGQVPTLGNPLGYLFVDKIFQDSITLQPPTEAVRVAYWHKVIGQDALSQQANNDAMLDEMRALEAAEETAEEAFKAAKGLDEIQALARQASEDTSRSETERRAYRNKAFEAVAQSSAVRTAAEHAFKDLHAIMPFNPRALKRLSNTLTLRIAEEAQAGHRIEARTLARWVVLEFSYPELADLLYENPEWAGYLINPDSIGALADSEAVKPLKPYLNVRAIQDIFVKEGEGLGPPLTTEGVKLITRGTVPATEDAEPDS